MAGQIERRAGPGRGPDRKRRRLLDHGAELGHVVDRDHHLDLERLAHAGVDHGDRPGSPHAVVAGRRAAEEASDLVERALGGREADALGRRPRRPRPPSARGARG